MVDIPRRRSALAEPGRLAGLTLRGRCLLAGGVATAVCGLVLDERDLVRLGVVVAALPLLALALAARTRRTVRATRAVDAPRLPVGTATEVALRLRGGPLFGSLRLADTVPDAVGPQPAAPPRFTVHRLGVRATVRLTYPLRPVLRGVHRVGPLTGRVTDPLGLAEFERELAAPDRLLVLPTVVGLRGLPLALGTGEGTPGAALFHQGQGSSDVLVRPYRQGDELRRVHWRSTARHDELMVRLEERPWRGGITVLLDRRDAAHRGRGATSSLEFAVALVASICVHLHARGEPVRLITEDGADPTGPGTGIDPVLDALAALRPSARTDVVGGAPDARGDLLAVLGATDPTELESLLARGRGGYAVVVDAASWDGSARTPDAHVAAATLRRAGWHVVVAGAGHTPDRAWDELVAGAPAEVSRAVAP